MRGRRLIPEMMALESKIALDGSVAPDAFGPDDPFNPFPVAEYGETTLPSDPNDTDGNGVPDDSEGGPQDYTPPVDDPNSDGSSTASDPNMDDSIPEDPFGPPSEDPPAQEPPSPDFDKDQPPGVDLPPTPVGPAGPAL